MLIDIHAHCYRRDAFFVNGKFNFPLEADLLRHYDRLGVDKGCILALTGPENNVPCSNEDILEFAERHPDRFIPFCNVHPRIAGNSPFTPLENILIQYRDAGCKGLGEVTCGFHFRDPFMMNLCRAAEFSGLPMTIHLASSPYDPYGIIEEPGLPGLEYVLMMFPKLRILGHSQVFWAEMAPLETPGARIGYPEGKITEEGVLPKLFRKYPNLYGDLSAGSGAKALMRDPEYACKFLTEFQDRLLFGLDICAREERESQHWLLDFLNGARGSGGISESVYEKVTWRNAAGLLNL